MSIFSISWIASGFFLSLSLWVKIAKQLSLISPANKLVIFLTILFWNSFSLFSDALTTKTIEFNWPISWENNLLYISKNSFSFLSFSICEFWLSLSFLVSPAPGVSINLNNLLLYLRLLTLYIVIKSVWLCVWSFSFLASPNINLYLILSSLVIPSKWFTYALIKVDFPVPDCPTNNIEIVSSFEEYSIFNG